MIQQENTADATLRTLHSSRSASPQPIALRCGSASDAVTVGMKNSHGKLKSSFTPK
jgi:hypothetical protein